MNPNKPNILSDNDFIGEDPRNLPTIVHTSNAEGYPLTPAQQEKLPKYLLIFCSPFIDGQDNIHVNIPLTSELLEAMRIHYGLARRPEYHQAATLIEKEITKFRKSIMGC